MADRIIRMSVLPGEPTDGSGRICIHLFVQDPTGPFVEPHVMHVVEGKIETRPTRGRLACDPKRTVAPVVRGNVTTITSRTDDVRAVTCPRCQASVFYSEAMKKIGEAK